MITKDRLTVVESVYHRPYGAEPTVAERRYTTQLDQAEQPYVRNTRVGEEWTKLDFGWIKDLGMLLIHNQEGKFTQVNPTPEEQERVAARVLEIGHPASDITWLVPPGASFRGCPNRSDLLYICCQSGEARYTLHAYPK